MGGFMLVSKTYAVYHTTNPAPVEDDHIKILAGVRSTEHQGNLGPFDKKGHSSNEKATHAGSISYMIGQSYAVTCEASSPDDNGSVRITCCNIAGMEVASL